MKYALEVAPCVMIYIPSFMKLGTGVQVILRFSSGNLNVSIGDGRDLLIMPLR
jgi:hypothetical protein